MSQIITYGAGETLWHVFNAVSALMNGKTGSIYQPVMLIAGMVGGIWAIGKAFWETSLIPLVTQWLIPMVILVGVCLVPSTRVHIKDVVTNFEENVDYVPLGLARTAQTVSTIGFAVTQAVEQLFAAPDHPQYIKTGMIFGAENVLELAPYAISNERLAFCMRDFVHNCITFDLTFNLYTMDELKQSSNIWELVKNRTSKVRMFTYCAEGARRCNLVTCNEGAKKLEELLKNHIKSFEKHRTYQNLSAFHKYLTGISKSAFELISQQTMMHSIIDAVERKCEATNLGSNFAIRRAYLQQRHTYEVVGTLAAKSLVVLRNVFEAITYAAFIFIMPFALVPMGFRIFGQWLSVLVWIQLWSPFYVILNSGIMSAGKFAAKNIQGIEYGLTFMTSTGLNNLSLDMQAYAAYASLSVPFVAYAFLKGGISSLSNVISSIKNVNETAGAAAAVEQTTGNYSYGNVSLDNHAHNNFSQDNISKHQHQLAPTLTYGFTQVNKGTQSTIYGQDGSMILDDPISNLSFDIQSNQLLSRGFKQSAQESSLKAEQHREAHIENLAEVHKCMSDFTSHLANNSSYDVSVSEQKSETISQLSSKTLRYAQVWGEKYGLDEKKSFELVSSAGTSTFGAFAKLLPFSYDAKGSKSKSKSEVYEEAQQHYKEQGFSENYQQLKSLTKDKRINSHDETGKRFAKSISDAEERSHHHQKQMDYHTQKSHHLTQLSEFSESQSLSVNKKLNQEFVEFLTNEKKASGGIRGIKEAQYIIRHSPKECEVALMRFSKMKQNQILGKHDLGTELGLENAKQTLSISSQPKVDWLRKL